MGLGSIFSFGNIATFLCVAYFSNTIWTLSHFWRNKTCENLKDPSCMHPYGGTAYKISIIASPYTSAGKREPVLVKTFNSDESWTEDVSFEIPKETVNNGSLYFITKVESVKLSKVEGVMPQPATFTAKISDFRIPTRHMNLVNEEKNDKEYGTDGSKPVTHITSTVGIISATDLIPLMVNAWPMEMRNVVILRKPKNKFLPPFEHDLLRSRHENGRELLPVNVTTTITIEYNPQSLGTYRFLKTMAFNFENMKAQFGFQDKDIDEVKGLLVDTSMRMLALTFFISTFHLLFDVLAFKADYQHWNERDSFVGISTNTVIWRAFSTLVILAHLMGEDTSYLITIPMVFSAIMEIWKVTKACHFKFQLKFWEKDTTHSKTEAETDKLDGESMKYLAYILWPLCIGGAIYSLIYQEHKSWVQWALTSIVNGVYAFGFIFMLPQLFINYKLKSVAALPWKAFMYKAFNTFIDDVFAFLIKMPTSHRVACFRDDIVFVFYLYQRYIYPVDKTRINEFGQTGEDKTDEKTEDKTPIESKKDQ